MTTEPYRLLDHTADLGIEIYGHDLPDLFANACLALFDNLVELTSVTGQSDTTLTVTGDDAADLMANWLRELLGLWTVDGLLIKYAQIPDIAEKKLTAMIFFDHYIPGYHVLKSEIKAVTYHNLMVEQKEPGWTARVVLDV